MDAKAVIVSSKAELSGIDGSADEKPPSEAIGTELVEKEALSQLSPNAKLFSISNLLNSKFCSANNSTLEDSPSKCQKLDELQVAVDGSQNCQKIFQFHSGRSFLSSDNNQLLTQSPDQLRRKIPANSRVKKVERIYEKENLEVANGSSHSGKNIAEDLDGKPECVLESKELWEKFSELGTEMIITKTGRRMFPTIRVSFSKLNRKKRYAIALDVTSVDSKRYRYAYHRSSWLVAGKADPPPPYRLYTHPDTPAMGQALESQIISFEKLKLTNNDIDGSGHIVLNSMHRYQPRIHLLELSVNQKLPITRVDEAAKCYTFQFHPTIFTAVTAYQNQLITKLKIDCNPFAKGFRDSSRLSDYERDAVESLFHQSNKPFPMLDIQALQSIIPGFSFPSFPATASPAANMDNSSTPPLTSFSTCSLISPTSPSSASNDPKKSPKLVLKLYPNCTASSEHEKKLINNNSLTAALSYSHASSLKLLKLFSQSKY